MRAVLAAAAVVLAFLCAPTVVTAQDSQTAPVAADKKPEPFAFADFTWLTGNPRTNEAALDSKAFTGEFRADTNFTYSFNKPIDDTTAGSTKTGTPSSLVPGWAPDLRKTENRPLSRYW